MRENASKIALFLLPVLLLLAPAASARPPKPAHGAPSRKPAHAIETLATQHPAHQTSRALKVEQRHALNAATRVPDRPISERHISDHLETESRHESRHTGQHSNQRLTPQTNERYGHRRPTSQPDETRLLRTSRVDRRRLEEPQANSRRQAAPLEEARVQPAPEAPAPEAAAVELPPIEVRHNRKLHLTPEPAAPAPESSPRKATVDDFLDTPAAPATNVGPAAAPPSDPAPTAPAARHPVSIVERKLPALPIVKAAAEIIPDPVTEPVLYTERGRLIVPPAMKGSHEILLHQNEMADRDGLIRVQDDIDLDRLRTSRELVALPVSPALEVDERLPLNRRFCRPWTAQFLASMARAHYARFHTPLQVNSAVRTVAFQERLRTTNGNAAPADGETASPHLTGQAVDLAKHGLSMTEIAWMRGYLMPLVQQGKVDVEEEFQQSCFHISVYKKYMPQAAPRRDIPTRRSPATALAAAIQ